MKAHWLDIVLAVLVAGVVSLPVRGADDGLATARSLYAAAEYEDALSALDRLQQLGETPTDDRRTIAQYRAYCLLALGRNADAEEAIAIVVNAMPLYTPSDSDVSPRVRTAFKEVRRRMLPVIIQERYVAAKAAFDRKEFDAAASGFAGVVAAIEDPDAAPYFDRPPLSDLRGLAIGFRDLSASAARPAPLPATLPPAAAVASQQAVVIPAKNRIYTAGDLNILPPVVVRQSLPPFPMNAIGAQPGVLDVLIDETGRVESVSLREPVSPAYDPALLEAARHWTYKPATFQGVPVKYRKMLQVSVKR